MSLLNNPFDPARETALVTGAGNGIGRAIAQALVGEGVRTVFADVNRETVTQAVASSPRPELAVTWIGDLAKRDACDALLADARAAVGTVTHFVHSASPARREADHAFAVSGDTWQQMHAVNLDAGFHLARELARPLIAAREPGSFLFLTSLHAGTPRNLPHYSTAKAAMAMLVRELAKTLGRFGIRVNASAWRHRRRRFRRRSRAGAAHPARPPRPQRRPRADGAGGAVEPALGLCHGRSVRGRWRLVANELVRAAGARRSLRAPCAVYHFNDLTMPRTKADVGGAIFVIKKEGPPTGRAKFREEERSICGTRFRASNDSAALA
jgi:3-oxoacyl-[acyl-carrier protein] reductase